MSEDIKQEQEYPEYSLLTTKDIIIGNYRSFTLANPEELMLYEQQELEISKGGLFLLPLSTKKWDQVDIIPKWRVIATGSKVEEELGIKARDIVVVYHYGGRLRTFGDLTVRYCHMSAILAKCTYEPSDYASFAEIIAKANNTQKDWQRPYANLLKLEDK